MIRIILACVLAVSVVSCGGNSGDDNNYIALGASDTTGVGAAPFKGWVFEVEDELDATCKNTALTNLGIPGGRADEIEDGAVPIANELNPDLITLWTGPNDIVSGYTADKFGGDLRAILSKLRDHTDAPIFVGNIPDMTLLPKFQDDPDPDVTHDRINEFNAVIAEVISEVPAVYPVDLATIPYNADYFADDGFHPSTEGHKVVADRFLEVIRPIYCVPDPEATI